MKYYLHPEIEVNEKVMKIVGRACGFHNSARDMFKTGVIKNVESIEWFIIDAIDDICNEFDDKWSYLMESTNCIYGIED